MDYNQDGYGSTVEKPKKKNYKIPITIAVAVGIVAAALIYYAMSIATTVTYEGDSLTPSNLSDYVDTMAESFYIDADSFTLYKDSTVTVEDGSVTALDIKMSLQYGSSFEYWRVTDTDGGIKMKYKGKHDDPVCYTLSQLCTYLVNIDGILCGELAETGYTAQFTASQSTTAQAGSYVWNGSAFEQLSSALTAEYYPITATTSNGTQYIFYVV